MYKKQREPMPSTANADGSLNVMVELRTEGIDPAQAMQTLLAGYHLDESYDPVPMAGGTVIVRCKVRTPSDIEQLKQRPGVVAVWTDTPIAPMTPQ